MKKAFSKKNLWESVPARIKKIISKILVLIPLKWLLGKRYKETYSLILNADTWSLDQIEQYQFTKVKEQIKAVLDKSPAYKKLYAKKGFDINDFISIKDISKLPLIDKEFINSNLDDLLLRDKNSVNVDYVTTGGTSGVPLTFYINSSRSEIEYAYLMSGWKRVGFSLGDTKAVLRGRITGSKKGIHQSYDPIFNEHFYSNFHMSDKDMIVYISHLKSLPNCFLHVYPSSIYQLARFAKKQNITFNNIKAILAESENVYPEQRIFVELIFNCRYFSSYGHSEKLIAAAECEYSNDYHVCPTYGFLELIDENGRAVTKKGQIGEIVGTGFINTVMPFIRYKTGDYAEYVGDFCDKCKRNHMVIRNIRGHNVQEHLVAVDNSLISWSAINMHDDTFDNVLRYQFYQDTPGVVIIKVIVGTDFVKENEQRIINNIGNKLKQRITVSILVVDDIPLTDRGKSVFVDQHINFSDS